MIRHALACIAQVCLLYTSPLGACQLLSGVFQFLVQGDLVFSLPEAVRSQDEGCSPGAERGPWSGHLNTFLFISWWFFQLQVYMDLPEKVCGSNCYCLSFLSEMREQVESLFASGLLLPGAFSFLSVQDVMIRERGPELGGLRDHPSLRFTNCLWRFKWVFQGLCKHCFRCCQLF